MAAFGTGRRRFVIIAVAALLVVAAAVVGVVRVLQPGSNAGTSSSAPLSASTRGASALAPSPLPGVLINGTLGSLAFDPDGTTIADRLGTGAVELRDAATGALLATLSTAADPLGSLPGTSVAFSPDGGTLAIGFTGDNHGKNARIELWNVSQRKLTTTIPLNGVGLFSVAFSPDGKTLAAGTGPYLALWNTTAHSMVYIPDSQHSLHGDATYVAFSRDGSTLGVADNDGFIRIWDIRSQRFTTSVTIPTTNAANPYVVTTSVSANGWDVIMAGDSSVTSPMANGQGTQTAQVPATWLWRPGTGKLTQLPQPAQTQAQSENTVQFSPATNLFAIGDDAGNVTFWNPSTQRTVGDLPTDAGTSVQSIAFSSNGRILATARTTGGGSSNNPTTSLLQLWNLYGSARTASGCTTATGSAPAIAYTTQSAVMLACGTGSPRALATFLPSDPAPQGPVWSWDASRVAWLTASRLSVFQPGTGALNNWDCTGCAGVAFDGDHAVSVAQADTDQAAAATRLLVFPATGSAPPTARAVTGIHTAGPDTDFRVLATISATDVVVAYGDAGGSDLGGTQLLYRVNAGGVATQYGHDSLGAVPTQSTITGRIEYVSTDPTGRQFGFAEYERGGACGGSSTAVFVNTSNDTATMPAAPAGGGTGGYWIEGVWFDNSGTPYVSLIPNESTCASGGDQPANGEAPANATPTVWELVNGRWISAGNGTIQAGNGPDGWTAQLSGTFADGTATATSLTLAHGGQTAKVSGVSDFAWASTRGAN